MATLTESIDWKTYTAPTRINVYFAPGGDIVDDLEENGQPSRTEAWTSAEITAAKAAYQNFANVANVKFNFVDNLFDADFVMIKDPGKIGSNVEGSLGYFQVGGGQLQIDDFIYTDLEGWGVFNSGDDTWTNASLAKGGYGYVTLIHEIGHGMGLAHPHDTGGNSPKMNGVNGSGDLGSFFLNQGIYTTMSYNDGWVKAPHGTSPSDNYGWQGSLMALDIAVLHQKYGANMSYNKGDNIYDMPTKNGPGTFYSAIWDAGGNDTIRYKGSAAAVINLTAATLDYSSTGGGVVSYAKGIHGGFTIANKVVIENAIGGSGNDKLTGNSAANKLTGGLGADIMKGLKGSDAYYVDNAKDVVDETGGSGTDRVYSSISFSLASTTQIKGLVENLSLTGKAAINGTGNGLDNAIYGNAGANKLSGAAGSDLLFGGLGKDRLTGGSGADTFKFNTIAETGKTAATRDVITDFAHKLDKISLVNIDAKSSVAGVLKGANDAFTFLAAEAKSGFAFTKKQGQLSWDKTTVSGNKVTIVAGDINGDGKADFHIELSGHITLTKADFIL